MCLAQTVVGTRPGNGSLRRRRPQHDLGARLLSHQRALDRIELSANTTDAAQQLSFVVDSVTHRHNIVWRVLDRRTLATALVINVVMFCVGLIFWRRARSAALLADALDMLADASGYAVAYLAIGGRAARQRAAARWNVAMLIALGLGVLAEVADR